MTRLQVLQNKNLTEWLSFAEKVELQRLEAEQTSAQIAQLVKPVPRQVAGWLLVCASTNETLDIFLPSDESKAQAMAANIPGAQLNPVYL
jgi:hypothetical protein